MDEEKFKKEIEELKNDLIQMNNDLAERLIKLEKDFNEIKNLVLEGIQKDVQDKLTALKAFIK